MAYTKWFSDWKDSPDTSTPIDQASLDHIEAGISDAAMTADAAIAKAIVDVKGDIITATAADTPVRKAAGANSKVLTADSGEADGLIWKFIVNAMVDAAAAIAVSKLAAGSDGQVLTTSGSTPTWAAASSGGTYNFYYTR